MAKPLVAIVGRPNVGKSTLFNRLLRSRVAITADEPGTTRDRLFATLEWLEKSFTIIDTGGLDIHPEAPLAIAVQNQVRLAIADADVIIFLVDVMDGVTPADVDVAQELRQSDKPVLLAANKADNQRRELGAAEFHRLGLGEPFPMSAYHNLGVDDLLDQVVKLLPPSPAEEVTEGMRLAIVGRPNVGKSMLLNAILGQERAVVSEAPGTTRDAVDTNLEYLGQRITLIDTAGVRRRGRVQPGIEKYSALRAFQAIERADIALLLLDASELTAAQDAHIAGYVLEAHKGLILVVNKWDLAQELELSPERCSARIRAQFKFAPFAPVLFLSALKGNGVEKVLETAGQVYAERHRRVPTGVLNRIVERAAGENLPRMVGRRRLHLLYSTQAGVNPPTFVFFVNDPKLLHFSYHRYLENQLRESFGFMGTSLRFIFKSRGER